MVTGAIAGGLILAFLIISGGQFHLGSMDAGQDARAYWRAVRVFPYGFDAGDFGAYLYSPAFLQLLDPILNLPWQAFIVAWAAILMATLLILTGPLLFVFALPIAFFEIWGGNIHLLLALAIVLGFRWPGAWAAVLLTKVTPGIGLLWFAARREWRALAIALGTTVAVVVASWLFAPDLWSAWASMLLREAGGQAAHGHIPVPIWVRLPLAALLTVYAARRDARWLMPVVVLLAMPVLWWGSLSVLIGSAALERRRLEAFVVGNIDRAINAIHSALPRRRLVAEPES